jgi:hypothetical protein
MFLNPTGRKHQHLVSVFGFVNVYGSTLLRADKQGPLPVSGAFAFCGAVLIVVHVD